MPQAKLTGVIITHVWDDDSTGKYRLDFHSDSLGKRVYLEEDSDTVTIHEGSWPEIKLQIDRLFENE